MRIINLFGAAIALFGITLATTLSGTSPAYACLEYPDSPPFTCASFYCGQEGNYWDRSVNKCKWRGFTGTHKQKSSTAGNCATCQLTAIHMAGAKQFPLISSNGWVATMTYQDIKGLKATGQGTWPQTPETFGDLAGRNFTVQLSRSTGNAKTFDMTIDTEGSFSIKEKYVMGKRLPGLAVGIAP